MKHKDLPERWKNKVVEYLRSRNIKKYNELGASDFLGNLIAQIKFEDGSYAEFRYPLIINAPEFDEVGVFTEHCGYHIFSLGGTYINLVDCPED